MPAETWTGERVLAYVDGRPAGAGGWTPVGDVSRLWGGRTHTACHGRGAYGAVLAERLRTPRALGLTRYGEQRIVEQPPA